MTQKEQTSEIEARWWALAALALSMLTIGLDATVLNVALPTLATELDASTSQLQWFVASYTLVLGALIIPMGSLGDRFGRKRLLLAGLAIFGASSAACAFADSAGVLIAARAFQGIGGAAMMPLSLAMLPVLFHDREERTRAMSIWVTCSAIGLPLGPIVGGWLLDHFSWGAVFLINVPLVAVGVLALSVYLPESRSTQTQPTDIPGIVLSSTGLVAVIYGLIEAGQDGWTSASVLAPILAGVALLDAFVAWERRSSHPLVDLALFSNRDFTIGTALATVANVALFGLLFVMPQYFQDVGGSNPLGTGVRLLPMIGGLIIATRIGPMLVERAGSRFVIIAGLALSAGALVLAATTDVDTSYAFAAALDHAPGRRHRTGPAGLDDHGHGRSVAGTVRLRLGSPAGPAAGRRHDRRRRTRHGAERGLPVPARRRQRAPLRRGRRALQRRRRHRSRPSARQLLAGAHGPVGVHPRDGHRAPGLRSPYDPGRRDRRAVSPSPRRRDACADLNRTSPRSRGRG